MLEDDDDLHGNPSAKAHIKQLRLRQHGDIMSERITQDEAKEAWRYIRSLLDTNTKDFITKDRIQVLDKFFDQPKRGPKSQR